MAGYPFMLVVNLAIVFGALTFHSLFTSKVSLVVLCAFLSQLLLSAPVFRVKYMWLDQSDIILDGGKLFHNLLLVVVLHLVQFLLKLFYSFVDTLIVPGYWNSIVMLGRWGFVRFFFDSDSLSLSFDVFDVESDKITTFDASHIFL